MVTENKKVRHDYFIVDEYEAGLVLKGTEVKSLRDGRANLKDAYARIKNGEVFVYQIHIGAYPFAYYGNHEPLRTRKLLLHRQEIKRLYSKVNEKGHTLVPLKLYFKGGKVKCPTVDGPVMLTLKPGANGGTVMRLSGKGWTKKSGKTKDGKPERGDQLVTLEIQMPEDLEALDTLLGDWKDPARPREKFGL